MFVCVCVCVCVRAHACAHEGERECGKKRETRKTMRENGRGRDCAYVCL